MPATQPELAPSRSWSASLRSPTDLRSPMICARRRQPEPDHQPEPPAAEPNLEEVDAALETAAVVSGPSTAAEPQLELFDERDILRILPLGGIGEIGKNMTVFEYGDQIVVIDCGLMFPEEEMFGVDFVVPDITYLKDRRHMVKAFLITHAHEDHVGGLTFILPEFPGVPVYTVARARAPGQQDQGIQAHQQPVAGVRSRRNGRGGCLHRDGLPHRPLDPGRHGHRPGEPGRPHRPHG